MRLTAKQFAAILAQPGYSADNWQSKPVKTVWPKAESKLEAKFAQLWALVKGPELQHNDKTKFRFHPTRNWKFDFYHEAARVAIEIQGGTRGKSRHTTHEGYKNDREKINAAQELGWVVFELTGDQIGWPELERIRDFINSRGEQQQ